MGHGLHSYVGLPEGHRIQWACDALMGTKLGCGGIKPTILQGYSGNHKQGDLLQKNSDQKCLYHGIYAKHGTNQAIFAKTSLQYSNRAMGHLPCTSMIFPFRCPSIGDFMGFLIAMFDYWRVIGFSPMSYIYICNGEIMGNLTTS